MIDEQALRRPTFVEGTPIRLANGQSWSLPDPPPYQEDDAHRLVLQAIGEAEDQRERLRGERALTVLLLTRNYHLRAADYAELLDFAPDDPALAEMQAAVSALATRQRLALRPVGAANPAVRGALPALDWFTHRFRRPGHARSS
jgi:hypothetical protein